MSTDRVSSLTAREILDSRGNPTVEVDLHLEDGSFGRAAVPSGASTGEFEAHELRDGDAKRYNGKGVQRAVAAANTIIADAVHGLPATEQKLIDQTMIDADGTGDKSKLGANAILAVSLAAARAAAAHRNLPLWAHIGSPDAGTMPVPMLNILNGGAHADTNVDIQEFMVIPTGAPSFPEALRAGVEIHHALRARLRTAGFATGLGDEGGFAPDLPSNAAALDIICEAISDAGFTVGADVLLGLDVASSEYFSDGVYTLAGEGKTLSSAEHAAWIAKLVSDYSIASVEDAMDEEDWQGWKALTDTVGATTQLVGDDLFVTNTERLQRGIDEGISNAILIKLNQIGTLTETLDAIAMAQDAGFGVVISHRSGETADATIAHLAVATGAGQIKTGAPARSDRVAKYNQLLRINEQLGDKAVWPGRSALVGQS